MGRVDLRHLVDRDHVRDVVQPRTTVLLGPWHAEEAQLSHLLDVLPGELGALVVLGGDRGDLLAGERADHLAHRQVLLAEVQ